MAATISYLGRGPAPSGRDITPPEMFAVRGDDYNFEVRAAATGSLDAIFKREGHEVGRVVRVAGLVEIESKIEAGDLPQEPDAENMEIIFSTDRHAELIALDASAKQCDWQVVDRRGLECDATRPGEERMTTAAACTACTFPDSRIICTHLSHPTNLPILGMGSFVRLPGPALCELGYDAGVGTECRVGGKDCWQRTVESAVAAATSASTIVSPASAATSPPETGGGDRSGADAAAAIDHFRAVYKQRYGDDVWKINQARSIADLSGVAQNEATFQRKVLVLGVLLADLHPHEQLDLELRCDERGNKVGGLVALERLMRRDAPGAVGDVQKLRSIAALRNGYPAHSTGRGFAAAAASLGFTYPPSDWDVAWQLVLRQFCDSLIALRIAISP